MTGFQDSYTVRNLMTRRLSYGLVLAGYVLAFSAGYISHALEVSAQICRLCSEATKGAVAIHSECAEEDGKPCRDPNRHHHHRGPHDHGYTCRICATLSQDIHVRDHDPLDATLLDLACDLENVVTLGLPLGFSIQTRAPPLHPPA